MPPVRFLAMGDSYTIGEGVPESARWPVQLVSRLREAGLDMNDPLIVAKTGWSTAELHKGIRQAGIDGRFNLVSLLVGVNNQYRGESLDAYRQGFLLLLGLAVQFAGDDPGGVIVLSIPDWGATPFARGRDQRSIASQIDAFNAINREVALAAGAAYIDVTSVTRRVSRDLAMLAEDGLHPSGEMYAVWVGLILPHVLVRLKKHAPVGAKRSVKRG